MPLGSVLVPLMLVLDVVKPSVTVGAGNFMGGKVNPAVLRSFKVTPVGNELIMALNKVNRSFPYFLSSIPLKSDTVPEMPLWAEVMVVATMRTAVVQFNDESGTK